jgi:hypothetical protein
MAPQNVGLLAIQPPDMATSPKIPCCIFVLIFCTPKAIGLPEGLKCRWEDNIKIHHKKIYCMQGNWRERTHDINQSVVPVPRLSFPFECLLTALKKP